MIFYYTRTKITAVFARAFQEILHLPLHEIESDINNKGKFSLFWLAIRGKPYPVNDIPKEFPNEIYIATPIWAGRLAAPVLYFLQNANLRDTKVNLILTASMPTIKYCEKAEKYLETLDLIPGKVYIFAGTKDPNIEAIKEQINELWRFELKTVLMESKMPNASTVFLMNSDTSLKQNDYII